VLSEPFAGVDPALGNMKCNGKRFELVDRLLNIVLSIALIVQLILGR